MVEDRQWVIVLADGITEAQCWAGIAALGLPGFGCSSRPKVTPVLSGSHRPGFVVSFTAMVAAAPPAACEEPPPIPSAS